MLRLSLRWSVMATAGCPSAGHRAIQRPSGAMVPAGASGLCCAEMAKAAASSEAWPGPVVENRTPSTSQLGGRSPLPGPGWRVKHLRRHRN
jgi:hypothetical protein